MLRTLITVVHNNRNKLFPSNKQYPDNNNQMLLPMLATKAWRRDGRLLKMKMKV